MKLINKEIKIENVVCEGGFDINNMIDKIGEIIITNEKIVMRCNYKSCEFNEFCLSKGIAFSRRYN